MVSICAPARSENLQRRIVGGKHFRLYASAFALRDPCQAQSANAALQPAHRVADRLALREWVERIGPLEHLIQKRRILHRAGDRSWRVQRRAQGQHTMHADAPDRRLQPGHAAERGRHTHRSAGIRADSPRRHARRDRDARAATRPAGHPMRAEVPRIPWRAHMLVRAPAAEREFHRMRLAEHDHAGLHDAPRERRGAARPPRRPRFRAAGRDAALKLDKVLECDRHAMQRPHRMARTDRFVSSFRRQPRILEIGLDEGMKLRVVRFDLRNGRINHIDG